MAQRQIGASRPDISYLTYRAIRRLKSLFRRPYPPIFTFGFEVRNGGAKLILTPHVRQQDIIQNSQNPAFPHVLTMDLIRPKIFEELGPRDQREMAI